MAGNLKNVLGERGEHLVFLCLSSYVNEEFAEPLFQPGFLGDKWPIIDYFVELNSVQGKRLYFFCQVKTTSRDLNMESEKLAISASREDIEKLMQYPGPTYILGVHEPSKKVFIRSVHAGTPTKAITQIPISYELNSANLVKLNNEVRSFWDTNFQKPNNSEFS